MTQDPRPMKRGKKICGELKKIRRRIADENGIKLDIPECTYEGDCRGTCPRCEWEVKYLEKTLFERLKLGKIATISGLALGLSACGGGGVGPDIQLVDELPNKDTQNVMSETVPPPPPFDDTLLEVVTDGIIIKDPTEDTLVEVVPDDELMGVAPMYDEKLAKKEIENEIHISVEEMPEFPGGEQALSDFISKNLRYPEGTDVSGRVFVQFVVEKDGTLTNYKIL